MAESDNASEISSDESDLSEENKSEQSSDQTLEPVTPGSRKRSTRLDNYMSGKSRKAYRVHEDLPKSVGSPPVMEGVCSVCQQGLTRVAEGFSRLRQGTELKK